MPIYRHGPMNACDFDHVTREETRLLPYGGEGNIIVCHAHYLLEMRARDNATTPAWENLTVYGPRCIATNGTRYLKTPATIAVHPR